MFNYLIYSYYITLYNFIDFVFITQIFYSKQIFGNTRQPQNHIFCYCFATTKYMYLPVHNLVLQLTHYICSTNTVRNICICLPARAQPHQYIYGAPIAYLISTWLCSTVSKQISKQGECSHGRTINEILILFFSKKKIE